jgi:thermostable 8-oxoguanine DNA glycosylase
MVNPVFFTNYDLDDQQLEEYVLFGIAAAGKNAKSSAKGLDKLLKSLHLELGIEGWYPFRVVSQFTPEQLATKLKECGLGCYNLKAKSFHIVATMGLDLRKCAPEDLERCPGIGCKTSRLFILHTRRRARVACLDTHLLKWMASLGHDVPKVSPKKKVYQRVEQIFLSLARERRMSPARLDLDIWRKYSGNTR